jgi:hypothetical protein
MDYGVDFERVVKGILDFVELEWVGQPPPFKMLAYDERYYSEEERLKIAKFMKVIASKRTWEEMSRYVAKYDEDAADREAQRAEQTTQTVSSTNKDISGNLQQVEQYSVKASSVSEKPQEQFYNQNVHNEGSISESTRQSAMIKSALDSAEEEYQSFTSPLIDSTGTAEQHQQQGQDYGIQSSSISEKPKDEFFNQGGTSESTQDTTAIGSAQQQQQQQLNTQPIEPEQEQEQFGTSTLSQGAMMSESQVQQKTDAQPFSTSNAQEQQQSSAYVSNQSGAVVESAQPQQQEVNAGSFATSNENERIFGPPKEYSYEPSEVSTMTLEEDGGVVTIPNGGQFGSTPVESPLDTTVSEMAQEQQSSTESVTSSTINDSDTASPMYTGTSVMPQQVQESGNTETTSKEDETDPDLLDQALSVQFPNIPSATLKNYNNRHLQSQPQQPSLKVAWLMSFPNSGTTFTQYVVQDTTQQSIASFYGHERVTKEGHTVRSPQSVLAFPDKLDGPYALSDEYPLPEKGYLLAKTHCGGYCFSDCPPTWFILNPQKFLKECTTGARFEEGNNEQIWVHYDPSIIAKALHIFRDPFDNIISRFHHETKLNARKSDQIKWERHYENDPDGFRQWCHDSDTRFADQLRWQFDQDTLKAFEGVPCHNEFFRYVQWHNNAFATTNNMKVPVLVVHYRDYADRLEETVDSVLAFLEQDRKKAESPSFKLKTYEGYYSEESKAKIRDLIQYLATVETWENVKRYF